MKYVKIVFIIMLLGLFSCAGEPGKDGTNGEDGIDGTNGIDGIDGEDGADSTSDIVIIYNIHGKGQKGPCLKDSEILIQPLDDGSFNQLGTHFVGFTEDDSGYYNIPAEVTGEYVEAYLEGECHNEITGSLGNQRLSGIIKVSDPVHNINPLTKIKSPVARWLLADGFGDVEESLAEAERLTLLFLGMPVVAKKFTEMSLENDSTADAVLALTSSMILYGRTDAEHGDYIVSISNAIINNDLILKAEITETFDQLPLITIKNNLENRYSELGIEIDTPRFWRLLNFPDYYADLLERDPVVISSFNMDDNTTCSFDQSTYNTFAIPHVFDSAITTSKYIALNFTGDISIWSHGFDVYDRPDVKLLDIERLNEIILTDPIPMVYNGLLGESHGLMPDTEYYIVIRSDTDFTLSTSCEGGFLPFGRKLASDDEGLNWIGHDNNTPFFRKSGIKMFTTN